MLSKLCCLRVGDFLEFFRVGSLVPTPEEELFLHFELLSGVLDGIISPCILDGFASIVNSPMNCVICLQIVCFLDLKW